MIDNDETEAVDGLHYAQQELQVVRIPIDDILVAGPRRPCDDAVVNNLAESMKTIGLMTPITLRKVVRNVAPDYFGADYAVVAGRHRFEAAKHLGWKEIDAFMVDVDDAGAPLWEIDENLQRKTLTALERDDLIVKRLELQKSIIGQVVRKGTVGRPQGGMANAARGLKFVGKTEEGGRKAAERALATKKVTPAARIILEQAGLANQNTFLTVVKEPGVDGQVKKAKELADRKLARPKKHGKKKTKVPAAPPVGAASHRLTPKEEEATRDHLAGIGHRIAPGDLIVAPESKSMQARPSEYAIIRIPDSHANREILKVAIVSIAREYNTEVFLKTLPQAAPVAEGGDSHVEEDAGKDVRDE